MNHHHPEKNPPLARDVLRGTWRRFGETGPIYEIVGPGAAGELADQVRVRVAITGEELDLPLAQVLGDPQAL